MHNISSKTMSRLEHATFWVFMFLFVFDYHFLENNLSKAVGSTLLELLTYAAIIYINLFLLIPLWLKKKQRSLYLVSVVVMVAAYIVLMRVTGWEYIFYEIGGWRNMFSMLLNTTLFLLISTLYWHFKQWQTDREHHLVLKSEKLEAELKFLRTQISPHFIFNTLNNIYALALEGHENAAPMIARLSTILRYVLYEGAGERVLMKKEIEMIQQYTDLFLLKKPRSKKVEIQFVGNPNGWQIAPMLLVNLVENALKHSHLEQDENAWVKICADISDKGFLVFRTDNSLPAAAPPQEGPGGIGLLNLRRQLEIYYSGNHHLELKHTGDTFSVQLSLQLKKNG